MPFDGSDIVTVNKLKTDPRPARGCWMPGDYLNQCLNCKKIYKGGVEAGCCADCEYDPDVDFFNTDPDLMGNA